MTVDLDQVASDAAREPETVVDLISRAQMTLEGAATCAAETDYEGLVNRLRLAHGFVGRVLVLARKHDEARRGQR